MFVVGKSLNNGTLIPVNLLHNPLVSCSLRNLDFLLSHTAHFVLITYEFLLSVFFLHCRQEDNNVLSIFKM